MKIFIVEDDPIIASDLEGILSDGGYTVCGIAYDPILAKKSIEKIKPDLILLDINLNHELDGVDLASLLKNGKYNFIFITAFTDKETIERVKLVEPLGYIIKPFEEKDIIVTLDLVFSKLKSKDQNIASPQIADNSIFVKTKNNNSVKINFHEILFLEAYDNYSFIHTLKEKHLVNYTLKDLEAKISSNSFLRTHRSYVVNIKHVDAIKDGDLAIGKHLIPVGKSYKEEVATHFPVL